MLNQENSNRDQNEIFLFELDALCMFRHIVILYKWSWASLIFI